MGLTYTRAGDYEIPNIALSQTGSIGHYGRLRREYLKEYRPVIFNTLVLSERLFPHLQEVERQAHNRMDELTELLKKERMIDESLKARDPMHWVGEMNNIHACAEEIVLKEIIYA